jgi:hypothetical protein
MYLSKDSKYAGGLLINISHFYIHHGLPWKTLLFLHLTGFTTTYYDYSCSHSLTAICGSIVVWFPQV